MGNGWSVAWRLHDAQFWGVPQRRKRIALVADFGGESAPEILFERESLSGDIEQSKQTRKEIAGDIGESPYQSAYTLKIRGGVEVDSYGKKAGKGAFLQTEKSGTLGVSQDQTLITVNGDKEKVGTLDASYYKGCGERQGIEREVLCLKEKVIKENNDPHTVVYGICSDGSNSMKSPNPHSGCYEADTTRTLDNNGGNPACNQGGMIIVDKEPMCIQRRFSSVNVSENNMSLTLEAGSGEGGNNMPIVLEGNGTRESHKGPGYKESDVMYSLNTVEQHAVCTYQDKTGTLSPGAHAGSYNGQDAYNDMLVIGGVQNQQQPVKPHFSNARSDGKSDTLVATDYKDPQLICYALDRASFNQGKNAQYDFSIQKGIAQPLVARGPGGVLTQLGHCAQETTKE